MLFGINCWSAVQFIRPCFTSARFTKNKQNRGNLTEIKPQLHPNSRGRVKCSTVWLEMRHEYLPSHIELWKIPFLKPQACASFSRKPSVQRRVHTCILTADVSSCSVLCCCAAAALYAHCCLTGEAGRVQQRQTVHCKRCLVTAGWSAAHEGNFHSKYWTLQPFFYTPFCFYVLIRSQN